MYAYGPQQHNLDAGRSAAPVEHNSEEVNARGRRYLQQFHVSPMLRQRALHRKLVAVGVAQQAQDALPSAGAGFGEIVRGEPVLGRRVRPTDQETGL